MRDRLEKAKDGVLRHHRLVTVVEDQLFLDILERMRPEENYSSFMRRLLEEYVNNNPPLSLVSE